MVDRGAVLAWLREHEGLVRAPVARRARLGTGLPALDGLLGGGLERGVITELTGAAGRSALAMTMLAEATRRGEVVAWIDAGNNLDPRAVAAAGARLERFLWARPDGADQPWQHVRQVLRAAEVVVEAGGFTGVVVDLGMLAGKAGSLRPAWWVRLQRRVEAAGVALLVVSHDALGTSQSALRLSCRVPRGARVLEVRVERRRGGCPDGSVSIALGQAHE